MRPILNPVRFFPVVLIACLYLGSAEAATVKAARSDRAILRLKEDEIVRVGDAIEITDSRGNRKATALVTIVKGRQAMVKIKSGETQPGDLAKVTGEADSEASGDQHPFRWNVLIGASNDGQSVRLSNSAKVNLAGVSPLARFSLSGPLKNKIEWEGGATLEYFQTKGTISTQVCRGSSECRVEMLNAVPFGRVGWLPFGENYLTSQLRAGVDAVVPLTASSNIVDTKAFQPLIVLVGGWAGRIPLSGETSLPLALEVGWHFGNNDATLLRIMFLTGYSW